jgi:hypothetical protein
MVVGEIQARVDRLVPGHTAGWEVISTGYSGAGRYRVELADGGACFVKVGLTRWSAGAVRREAALYGKLARPFVPAMVGADLDDPPLIVLEDLSWAEWPPPWTSEGVERVRSLLGEIADTSPPPHLKSVAELRDLLMRGWSEVATDASSFLALGLCSAAWLDAALPRLLEAQDAIDLDGRTLTHFDVRSDNVCFAGPRTVLVDWAGACVAHFLTDLIKWLPSLHAEGGPPPQAILPDAPAGAVAVLAGFWAANAGREPPPGAPSVREIQRRQLAVALPWAALTLGLPEPQPTEQMP